MGLGSIFGSYSSRQLKKIEPMQKKTLALEDTYRKKSDSELKAVTAELKERLANGETLDDILPDAFAAVREAADRVIGLRCFPVQIIGGILLHQGRISEMKTGEGKTIVATLPAYLNALTGKGVHIVTVNDYLAKFHSEWMGKVYRFLGLSVGLIVHGLTKEERKEAYAADITYATNNEIGFDYLFDNMCTYKEQQVQRGHNFAIVDEVDSILIDEARTPLIISGTGDKSTDMYTVANNFAKTLKPIIIAESDTKSNNDDIGGDYIVDEKARSATLTQEGVKKAERYFNLINLTDAENITIAHHINQAIKAHGVMKNDIDYVVKDGEIIIVDEFTGRLMLGRRFNEGLHQAIEAKEGVEVKRESKTLATITFQNLFRMYSKLSGMTGTAMTEEEEFRTIYSLDVVEVPTNRPVIRDDLPDAVFKTEKGKFGAVVEQIEECVKKGQPVLVGTISIEKSELVSSMLKRRGIRHEVLNAKYHEKEAEIVAQAGKFGAVTISTNMAGRGTDIKLGGNSEFLAVKEIRKEYSEDVITDATGFGDTDNEEVLEAREKYLGYLEKYNRELGPEAQKVKDAGGLFIIGTERHESRRIDNQLRGRSGRQGDPGVTRFFISLEDDLMRLFGGERLQNIMNNLGVDENMMIENKMLSGSIENAQRKVESRNFGARKNTLELDDVMNRHREVIYSQRERVLSGENLREHMIKMVTTSIETAVNLYITDDDIRDNWDLAGLRAQFLGLLTDSDSFTYDRETFERVEKHEILDELLGKAMALYEAREKLFGEEVMRELERKVLLQVVDNYWTDHIDNMSELQKGIFLRSYAQRDPVVEYRLEGSEMFDNMISAIRDDTVKIILSVQIRTEQDLERKQENKPTFAGGASDGSVTQAPVKKGKKIGPNEPCPCGSGKKYKKCCGA